MNLTHFLEAVFLGLCVGLMLWVLKSRDGQKKLKLWVLATGLVMSIYLGLLITGVAPEGMVIRILLALAIMMAANTILQFVTLLISEHLAKKKIVIPRLVIDVLTFIVMATVAVILLNTLFSVKLTAFLVTSTVLSAVIGLSLQDILGNVFAGLALQLERPYEMEDWVEIDGIQGSIAEMNWRVLTLRTRDNDLMSIPNATVSKTSVTNFSKPTKLHLTHIKVGIAYAEPPERVKKILLGAVTDTSGVSAKPSPSVFLADFSDSFVTYDVRFWITDFARKPNISDAIRSRIWYCLQRAGISIPFPISDIYLHTVSPDHEEKRKSEINDDIIRELTKIDLFKPLSELDISILADSSSILRYTRGESIVTQGDMGDSLFIIHSGSVEVTLRTGKNDPAPVANLSAGACFGEMSLLTGEPRSATVSALEETQVVVVRKDGLKTIFESNPSLMEPLSAMLEKRQLELDASRKAASSRRKRNDDNAGDGHRDDIFARVRAFFKL